MRLLSVNDTFPNICTPQSLPIAKLISSAQDVAQNHELLHALQITHIVNVATGVECMFRERIEYLDLTSVLDMPSENLKQHFERATTFMRNAVESGQGRVGMVMKICECHL